MSVNGGAVHSGRGSDAGVPGSGRGSGSGIGGSGRGTGSGGRPNCGVGTGGSGRGIGSGWGKGSGAGDGSGSIGGSGNGGSFGSCATTSTQGAMIGAGGSSWNPPGGSGAVSVESGAPAPFIAAASNCAGTGSGSFAPSGTSHSQQSLHLLHRSQR